MTDPIDQNILDELKDLRRAQDIIDDKIIDAIAERIAMRRKISGLRIKNELPTVDVARIQEVLLQAENIAKDKDVPVQMIREIFTVLIDWSHKLDYEWRDNPSSLK